MISFQIYKNPTQTDIKGALIDAERVRTNVEYTLFPDIGPNFKITVSIGQWRLLDADER
jgi:hypothetical protein